ncbi:hypothetical protein FGIG_00466 [Fasciola gigantica]|uniref:Uncharacterized protein n=1 Tax=Fasciola gigantica TaxID=46835 RepID=A0A504Z288_FASGI|nr:hypothetical protein FGIG_00466 [Fasciola gigantica]
MQYTGESQYRVMSLLFVSLNNNDWQSPPVFEGLLNGKEAKPLIDNGSSCSVINPSLTKISHSVPLNGRPIAANGTVMPILGQVAGSNAQVSYPYISFIYKRPAESGLKPSGFEMSERPKDERALWAKWTKPVTINGVLHLLGRITRCALSYLARNPKPHSDDT